MKGLFSMSILLVFIILVVMVGAIFDISDQKATGQLEPAFTFQMAEAIGLSILRMSWFLIKLALFFIILVPLTISVFGLIIAYITGMAEAMYSWVQAKQF